MTEHHWQILAEAEAIVALEHVRCTAGLQRRLIREVNRRQRSPGLEAWIAVLGASLVLGTARHSLLTYPDEPTSADRATL